MELRYRLSAPNLITAAIVLWNTVLSGVGYQRMYRHAAPMDNALLQSLLPLGLMRINPADNCLCKISGKVVTSKPGLRTFLQLT